MVISQAWLLLHPANGSDIIPGIRFLFRQSMRPGGRFAYGLEASAQDMKNKDIAIKAQRRFEQDTDSLLR